MFKQWLAKCLFPMSSALLLTNFHFNNQIHLLETSRANKPELVSAMNSAKQQTIILIYNRESESSVLNKIMEVEKVCKQSNISKLILVDQTDIRHLQVFTKMMRMDIEEGKNYAELPIDLQGKIKLFYLNPVYDTMKPFTISSSDRIKSEVQEIRSFYTSNPTPQQYNKSLQQFNKISILKHCYNETCISQYKQKIRQLIQFNLLKGKKDNYEFFVTSDKVQAQKLHSLVPESTNKQQTYAHFNDMLGNNFKLFTPWLQKQGSKYVNNNQFMMFIRPRVHIMSKTNLHTDLFWYFSTINNNNLSTFSINNTVNLNNTPKSYFQDIQLLKSIKEHYPEKVELMVIQNRTAYELLRHVYQPWRYTIFHSLRNVPYSKMHIKLPSCKPFQERQKQVLQKIESFTKNPKNYSPIIMYQQKEKQINVSDVEQLMNNGKYERWILRVCGKNNCIESVYQKYGINQKIPVFKLDGLVQNIGLEEGDYAIEEGLLSRIMSDQIIQ